MIFTILASLEKHTKVLLAQAHHMQQLLATIDNTIQHLQGKKMIQHTEFYKGFDQEKQNEYEEYITHTYTQGKMLVDESKKTIKNWKKENCDAYYTTSNVVHRTLVQLMHKDFAPQSLEVQAIADHFELIKLFYTPTAEVYAGLGDLYTDHPDFRKFFDAYDANLAQFIAAVMKLYAKKIIPSSVLL